MPNIKKIKIDASILWLYGDRALKAFSNITMTIVAFRMLESAEYFDFITMLSLYYVFYAISGLGLDSKIYSRIKNGKINKSVVHDYIKIRFFYTIIAMVIFLVNAIYIVDVSNKMIIVIFMFSLLFRVCDVFEFLLIGTNRKATYSKIGLTINSLFFVVRLGLLLFSFNSIFLLTYFVEASVTALIYWAYVKKENIIDKEGDSLKLISFRDLLLLSISSILTIILLRFDQVALPKLFDKELVIFYFTLVRFYEPFLTFVQILATYYMSTIKSLFSLKDVIIKYHFISIMFLVLQTLLIIFIIVPYTLEKNDMDIHGSLYLILISLSFLYFANSSRVIFGKVMVYLGLYDVLLIRILIGVFLLIICNFIIGFSSIENLILSIILSIVAMNLFSYSFIIRKVKVENNFGE